MWRAFWKIGFWNLDLLPYSTCVQVGCLALAKNQANVALCLDNKYAETRHKNVVNLGGSIIELQRDVIQQMEVWRTKVSLY